MALGAVLAIGVGGAVLAWAVNGALWMLMTAFGPNLVRPLYTRRVLLLLGGFLALPGCALRLARPAA